ncbi:MAG: hypothetical protein FWF49_02510, partial [Oscillospiraceae bacterium]|nr:hypothetical protein [Oscillospiraceae bacterium]
DFRKILCAPLGVDQTADFEKMFSPKPADGDYEVTDIPLYVGPDYVSYVENRFASAGGSGSWDTSAVRFDKLDNLSAFTAVYGDTNSLDVEISLTPHFQETTLADALYGTQANALYQADVHTYRETTVNTYTDFRQLAIKRNLGKWSLMLPMLQDNYARNGSYSNWINDFAVYSNDVPTALASDSSNVTVGGSNGDDFAKDLLDFPGSVAGLSQDDYFIYMTHQGNDFDSDLDLSIPVNLDENIVSINFAGAATQAAWTNELSQIGS